MTKPELIGNIALLTGQTKSDTEKFLKAFEDVVTDSLVNGDKVQLVGFLTFDVVDKPEREGRNPSTGITITIPAKKVPRVKIGKTLKDAVKG